MRVQWVLHLRLLLRNITFGKNGLNYFTHCHMSQVSSDFQLIFHAWCFHQPEKDPKLGETFSCPYYLVDDAVFMLFPDIRCFSVTACDAWHAHQ